MNRTYEAMVLLDNREVKKGWQNLKDEVCALFQKHGADVKSARRWDERRLAYPINQQLRATYLLLYLESDTQALTPIRRELEYAEPVMRHLIQVCEEIPAGAYDAEETFDESQVRVEDTGTRPEPGAAEAAGEAAGGEEAKGETAGEAGGEADAGGEAAGGKEQPKAEAGSDEAQKKEDN